MVAHDGSFWLLGSGIALSLYNEPGMLGIGVVVEALEKD
jgi:hypothetical protein